MKKMLVVFLTLALAACGKDGDGDGGRSRSVTVDYTGAVVGGIDKLSLVMVSVPNGTSNWLENYMPYPNDELTFRLSGRPDRRGKFEFYVPASGLNTDPWGVTFDLGRATFVGQDDDVPVGEFVLVDPANPDREAWFVWSDIDLEIYGVVFAPGNNNIVWVYDDSDGNRLELAHGWNTIIYELTAPDRHKIYNGPVDDFQWVWRPY